MIKKDVKKALIGAVRLETKTFTHGEIMVGDKMAIVFHKAHTRENIYQDDCFYCVEKIDEKITKWMVSEGVSLDTPYYLLGRFTEELHCKVRMVEVALGGKPEYRGGGRGYRYPNSRHLVICPKCSVVIEWPPIVD